jgi:hypothetical protein
VHRPEPALWLLEQIDSPGLTIHFDISHFNVQGMTMEPVIAQLAPHSAHTHVKDERGVAPDHEFLIPGEGEMDYVRYLTAMQRAGYSGHIAVEISLMVQRRADYDALKAASQSYRVLARAFDDAGSARERVINAPVSRGQGHSRSCRSASRRLHGDRLERRDRGGRRSGHTALPCVPCRRSDPRSSLRRRGVPP